MSDDSLPRLKVDAIEGTLELEYPCRWLFKVIGPTAEGVRGAVLETIHGTDTTLEESNRSSDGRYVSFNVEVTATDEAHRTGMYEALRSHPDVRMVL